MKKCDLDWRTCGHCNAGLDDCGSGITGVYPFCDKAGFFRSLIGDDMCPNAPVPHVEEVVARMRRAKEKMEAERMTDGSEQMMQMLSKLFDIKAKYENLKAVLSRHVENPDDLQEVEEVLGKAGSDDLLDQLMETTGHDQYVDFEEFVCNAARYRDSTRGFAPLAWVRVDDHGMTPDFWDCECKHDFIHPKTQESCPECGVFQDDRPDSHYLQVRAQFDRKLGLKNPYEYNDKPEADRC